MKVTSVVPTNEPPMAIRDKTTINKWDMREVRNYSTHIHLLNTIKSILTQTFEKLCKKRVFDSLYFWNTLNKTHQGISVWNRNNRLHTSNKNYVYKERKETTHVRIGERNIYQHMKKISTMYVNNGHKTHIQEWMYLK